MEMLVVVPKRRHRHKGSVDKNCAKCGYSIYAYWHTNSFYFKPIYDMTKELWDRCTK